jgi:hypothetical protein
MTPPPYSRYTPPPLTTAERSLIDELMLKSTWIAGDERLGVAWLASAIGAIAKLRNVDPDIVCQTVLDGYDAMEE